jgi:large subunit ribosomal protein L21
VPAGAGTKAIPKEEPIYAIVRAGGRQYRVEPDQQLSVDRIQAEAGSTVDLDVLMLGGDGDVRVGTPTVAGARVVAEVLEHGRAAKILVFKYKNKTRYRRRHGHRQDFTRLAIRQIITGPGETAVGAETPPKPARRRAQPKAEAGAGPIEAAVAEAQEAVVAAGAPATEAKPRRPRAPKPAAVAPKAAKPPVRARAPRAAKAPEAEAGLAKPARRPRAMSELEAAAAAELTVEETPLEPPPAEKPPARRPRRPTRQEGR